MAERAAAWPAVAYEELPWVGSDEIPRRWRSTFTGPYQAAVLPQIANRSPSLPAPTAALVDDATAELTRFDAEMGSELATFGPILLRSESTASSRIENLTASAKAIALAELGDTTRRNTAEIVANTGAMQAALDLADRLDGDAILAMHRALLVAHAPQIAGRWRDAPVWIGTSSFGPHTASFVPPAHERVGAAIDDLVVFLRRDDLTVLLQAALGHAQFETIHPFADGNGRTGRAIVQSVLRAKGVTRQIAVPVSAGLLVDVERYFDALDAYRAGDVVPIVERFAEASYASVVNGRTLVSELRALREAWNDSLTARPQAIVYRALDVVLRHPVLDNELLRRELDVSVMGAAAAIDHLLQADVLEQITAGRRNRRYAAPSVLAAVDAFAERASRRAGFESDH